MRERGQGSEKDPRRPSPGPSALSIAACSLQLRPHGGAPRPGSVGHCHLQKDPTLEVAILQSSLTPPLPPSSWEDHKALTYWPPVGKPSLLLRCEHCSGCGTDRTQQGKVLICPLTSRTGIFQEPSLDSTFPSTQNPILPHELIAFPNSFLLVTGSIGTEHN